jgi:hypothetical protein
MPAEVAGGACSAEDGSTRRHPHDGTCGAARSRRHRREETLQAFLRRREPRIGELRMPSRTRRFEEICAPPEAPAQKQNAREIA